MNMIDKDSVAVQASASAFFTCATGIPTGTTYTGDTIQGEAVISQLDVRDLEPDKKHRFSFKGLKSSPSSAPNGGVDEEAGIA